MVGGGGVSGPDPEDDLKQQCSTGRADFSALSSKVSQTFELFRNQIMSQVPLSGQVKQMYSAVALFYMAS